MFFVTFEKQTFREPSLIGTLAMQKDHLQKDTQKPATCLSNYLLLQVPEKISFRKSSKLVEMDDKKKTLAVKKTWLSIIPGWNIWVSVAFNATRHAMGRLSPNFYSNLFYIPLRKGMNPHLFTVAVFTEDP